MIQYIFFMQSDWNQSTDKLHLLSGISCNSSVCIEVGIGCTGSHYWSGHLDCITTAQRTAQEGKMWNWYKNLLGISDQSYDSINGNKFESTNKTWANVTILGIFQPSFWSYNVNYTLMIWIGKNLSMKLTTHFLVCYNAALAWIFQIFKFCGCSI